MKNRFHILLIFTLTTQVLLAQNIYQAIGKYEDAAKKATVKADTLSDYQAAITDASVPAAGKINRNLMPIHQKESDLKWQDDKVLLVTWTSWDGYNGQEGQAIELGTDVWITPFPQLHDFCAKSELQGTDLELRLKQLLGLPPTASHQYVVEMWVDPQDLFRPSIDPEITDHESELTLPDSSTYLTVSTAHQSWISQLQSVSYGTDGYPWTQLGYTYDWVTPGGIGLSEYVVKSGATVTIERVQTTEEYRHQSEYHLQRVITDFVEYAKNAQEEWLVPGMSIAIVKDDQILLQQAFGYKEAEKINPVDTQTLFSIGSVSKSFTSAMLSKQIELGTLQWDSRVQEIYPSFNLQDVRAAEQFTLRDLMSQHSGLPAQSVTALGMFGYQNEGLFNAIKYMTPVGIFRRDFAYQNVLFNLAAQLATEKTGKTYEQLIQETIFQPLGMNRSKVAVADFVNETNRVKTYHYQHQLIANGIEEITPENSPMYYWADSFQPAGSIASSIEDMTKYLTFQINNGRYESTQVVSEEALAETRWPQTSIMPPFAGDAMDYCMGFVMQRYHDTYLIWHNGNTNTCKTILGWNPDEKLGIVILSNVGASNLPDALMYQFYDMYFDYPDIDHSKTMLADAMAEEANIDPERPDPVTPPKELSEYAGSYTNSACGTTTIAISGDKLILSIGPKNHLIEMEHWNANTFRITNNYKIMELDHKMRLVEFQEDDQNHITGLTLELFTYPAFREYQKTQTSVHDKTWKTMK